MPTNMGNMFQFINMVKNGNPQQIVLNILQEKAQQGNPMFSNLLDLARKGDTEQIETVVRNMARERGIDYDNEFNSFRNNLKL